MARLKPETLEQIRQGVDWRDSFLEDEGRIHIACVNRDAHRNGDRTPSMAVYGDHVHCYGCGLHSYDLVDVAMRSWGVDFKTAARRLWRVLEGHGSRQEQRRTLITEPVPYGQVTRWMYAMQDDGYAYLKEKWGISVAVAMVADVGYTGSAFAFPHHDFEGSVLNVKFRIDQRRFPDHDLKYWGMKHRRSPAPYPGRIAGEYMVSPPAELMLCEGETDTLSALSNQAGLGLGAVGVVEGAQAPLFELPGWVEFWTRMREAGTFVWVAYDNGEFEPKSEEAAQAAIRQLTEFGIEAGRAAPEGAKDISELNTANRRREGLLVV